MHLSNNPPPDAAHLGRTLILQDAQARVAKATRHLEGMQAAIKGRMPVNEAEALLDEVEDYFDILRVKFSRTLHVLDVELERLQAEAA